MNRHENITRLAARALGRDLTGHTWIHNEQGRIGMFRVFGADVDLNDGFAPLSDKSTAYIMEHTLRMNVEYKHIAGCTVIKVTRENDGGAIMHTVHADEDALVARMFAVTQFAALYCLALDRDEETRADLERIEQDQIAVECGMSCHG